MVAFKACSSMSFYINFCSCNKKDFCSLLVEKVSRSSNFSLEQIKKKIEVFHHGSKDLFNNSNILKLVFMKKDSLVHHGDFKAMHISLLHFLDIFSSWSPKFALNCLFDGFFSKIKRSITWNKQLLTFRYFNFYAFNLLILF